ncbi:Miro domain protein (plasmid) [Haliscomenobacter hydrossis DSM 1100]|uniref:non-specific serine/threonine protein kinase n=2 Tax=Haliscomenobacter TaxID=2349 RepID=F4L800_HALH1|nr:Miro domain protein [Haliscomenobacter hydrossis DSM 1100]
MEENLAIALYLIRENKRTQSPRLDLSCLGLTELPDELWECTWVQQLSLGRKQWNEERQSWSLQDYHNRSTFTSLPNKIAQLTNLKTLLLDGVPSIDLTPLTGLKSLLHLDISDADITDITPISALTHLKVLQLSVDDIPDLSPLNSLVNLEELVLDHKELRDASLLLKGGRKVNIREFHQPKGVTKFDLEWIKHLSKLKNLKLELSYSKKLELLNQLVNLEELDIHFTEKDFFSDDITLPKLKNLTLHNAGAHNLGKLYDFPYIEHLTFVSSHLTDFQIFKNLKSLKKIEVWMLSKFDTLNGINDLINLQFLSVNGFGYFDDLSPLLKLSNLRHLDIRCSNSADLLLLTHLKNLESLKLNAFYQTNFPFELLSLPHLTHLGVKGSQFLNIPQELTNQENSLPFLRAYHHDLQQGSYPAYEAKQLIVGNGRVGKTSLLKALYQLDTFNAEEDSTHGIQLYEAQIPLTTLQKQLSLSIWDFGGQELYHATHRIFMLGKAVYLVLWEPEMESKLLEDSQNQPNEVYLSRNFPLEYWLGNIRAINKPSEIIVVCNKMDNGREQFPANLHSLQEEYGIDSFISVSAKTGYGIDALLTRLKYLYAQIPELGMPRPLSWRKVQEKLAVLRQNKPYISLEEYHTVCTSENLDTASSAALLHFLGFSGYLLNFTENHIVLDQKWALDAVYRLFDREHWYPLLKGNALRKRSELAKCWREFTPEHIELFLRLMMVSEQALKLDKENEDPYYLIPEFLPNTQAPAVADIWSAFSSPIYHFRFRHHFFHAALIQRFIVRIAKLVERYDMLWHTGFLFNAEGTMAFIQTYPTQGRFEVQIKGLEPEEMIELLEDEILRIQPGVPKSAFEISLNAQPDAWVSLEQLREKVKAGKTHLASTTGEILELIPFLKLLPISRLKDDSPKTSYDLKKITDQQSGAQLLDPTPPPPPLESLKLLVKKKLINDGIAVAIACLEKHLLANSAPANDLIVISSQCHDFNRNVAKGLHSTDEQYLLSNRISNQIVALLTTIQERDLK